MPGATWPWWATWWSACSSSGACGVRSLVTVRTVPVLPVLPRLHGKQSQRADAQETPLQQRSNADALQRPTLRARLASTPPLMLGGNVFGWTADRDSSFAVLDAFVEGGGRLIDTADMYTDWIPGHVGGESERMIGAWLASRGHRDRVLIATKVGRGKGEVAGVARERADDAGGLDAPDRLDGARRVLH